MNNSPYSLSETQRTKLEEKIMAELNREEVVKVLKSALEEYCQRAIDQTTDYLNGEYQLVLEEIVRNRASQLVKELLKGNREVAQFFSLEARTISWGAHKGEEFVYDPDNVRHAIFDRFKDEIAHAELVELREENERLKRDLKYYQERDRYRY